MKPWLFFLLMLAGSALAEPADLERVQALARGGAPHLALHLIDKHQPASAADKAWVGWEEQRYVVYFTQRDWAAIGARAARLPDGVPDGFRRWARTQAAQARLYAEDGAGARRILRDLLWDDGADTASVAQWRQMIIRSYLIEDSLSDAQAAVLRYQQDYAVTDDSWRLLHATLLMRMNDHRAALPVLAGIQTHEGRLLIQLARLRSRTQKPQSVLAEADKLVQETRNKPAPQFQAWALSAEAAAMTGDRLLRVIALERALTLKREHGARERLFLVDSEDLWRAYAQYAEADGKQARLAVGRDADWVKKAAAFKRDDAVNARAYYAWLAGRARSPEIRELAHARLAASLAVDGREEVLRWLYVDSSRYRRLEDIPAAVRYRLFDRAIAVYDIKAAARLLDGLPGPPPNEHPDLWVLKRARVMIYAGELNSALQTLSNILVDKKKVDDELAERYTQVMFDLQASDRHREAAVLLESLFGLVDNARMRRELLFWEADSRSALGEHAKAAELYLRSATYGSASAGDLWGQSARYHAAEALGKAGMVADARSVYQNLLEFTDDPKQRLLIDRQLQQLWLLEQKTTTP